jgi:hypothetical protein
VEDDLENDLGRGIVGRTMSRMVWRMTLGWDDSGLADVRASMAEAVG